MRMRVTIAVVALLGCAHAHADDKASLKMLESEFWACDYAATTRGPDATDYDACVVNYEALKKAKFGGDAVALVSWWQRNKSAAHGTLAESGKALAGR
jgi:hypothetical protein